MLYLFLGFLTIFIVARLLRRKQPAPYPPGPKGLPLVGNIFDRPSTYPWLTYTQWGRTYGMQHLLYPFKHSNSLAFSHSKQGDIVYVDFLGQPVVILNSAKQASAMLDKKSAIYSDRPVLQMSAKLMGWDQITGLIPYGHQLREHRRYISHWIGSKGLVQKHQETLINENRKFLKKILADDEDLSMKIRKQVSLLTLILVISSRNFLSQSIRRCHAQTRIWIHRTGRSRPDDKIS